ncbi:hypothetical protein OIU83_21295 [Flavobacterium sp. LS1R49]|uniref:C1q domain-containing protein n=1 Tax=Flavobacterium shii TaxID=2987687 RepID=A0A9X3C843_9FLAO|nr:hypothetical protein [Flavobacterium shii]MCV9930208.1 hypothetical protein [Flavobacterium shii]
MKRKIILLITLFVMSFSMTAQVKVGSNPTTINTNSLLELESTSKGLLLPRVALTSTTSFAPLTAHIAGMTVYNTAAAGTGTTAVVAGYYYNDGTQWVQILNQANALTLQPWFNSATNSAATSNTQNIYQSGNVGILTGTTAPTAALDVNGTTRLRSLPTGLASDNLVTADANGNLRTLAAAKPSVMVVGLPAAATISSLGAGSSSQFTTATSIVNTISGSSYSAGVITLPAGTYSFVFVISSSFSGAAGIQVMSYFFDFPGSSGTTRIHGNSPTYNAVNGVSINFTSVLTATTTFNYQVGWGQGGNVTTGTPIIFGTGTQIFIQKLL